MSNRYGSEENPLALDIERLELDGVDIEELRNILEGTPTRAGALGVEAGSQAGDFEGMVAYIDGQEVPITGGRANITGVGEFDLAGYAYKPVAIPDSEADQKLIHRWPYIAGSGSTAADAEGSADGTINGPSWVAGDWIEGQALDGDGTNDTVNVGQLGSFGSSMSSDFAVAFSIGSYSADSSTTYPFAVRNSGDSTFLGLRTGDNGDNGVLEWLLDDASGDRLSITGSTELSNASLPLRIVYNKTANSASGLEIWVDGSEDSTSTNTDQAFSNPANFDTDATHFAFNDGGSVGSYLDATLDDPCIFGDSLTQTEIQSYENPWD